MENFVVAIDGPAGSGKSSISKLICEKLGFTHIDTGAMYRAVTLEAINRNINLDNEEEYTFLNDIEVLYKNNIIYLNGKDVSLDIRSSLVTNNVSTTAKLKSVRDIMVKFQRASCKTGKVLMDGRDIGTVVLPNADLKIFLTADPKERAKRRCKENEALGIESNYEVILKEIIERDYKDANREIAPLKQASDAILVDTTKMSIEQVVEHITNLILRKRLVKMEDFKMEQFEMPKQLKKGDKLTGTVVSVTDKTIYLDIKSYTEGTMHLDHYTTDKSVTTFKGLVKEGDVIVCEVAKFNEDNIYLSRLNQLKEENFKRVIDAKANDLTIEVKVVRDLGKGFEATYESNKVFMPKSCAADAKVGDTVSVKIIELDEKTHNCVVSKRAVDQLVYQENKAKELDSINVGDVVCAEVVKIEAFGAFLKLNYNQGLLRTKDISHLFVDIKKELKLGDKIEVKVIDKTNGKLLFSKKALLETPFELFAKEHKVGQTITAKVANKLPFGLLLEVSEGVKGLLHSSEYSHNPNDNFNNCVVLGDSVEVAILGIDTKGEKLSLSRKALMDNPWVRVKAHEGDLVDVVVEEVTEAGLVVSALGVDGFIPANETTLEPLKAALSSYFAKGDTYKAYITELKPLEWKLKLSIKKLLKEEERKSFEKYLENDDTNPTLGDMFKDILK